MQMTESCHATSVCVVGRGLMILGAAGSGKSSLALELMARGAQLIADDSTILTRREDSVILSCSPPVSGMIEARGLGLLNAAPAAQTPLAAVLDMDKVETERLPVWRTVDVLGVPMALLHKVETPYFPAALLQYLLAGRRE